MVFQKRLDYGFNGYQVPPTPRAARSARKRSINRRKFNDSQMCAFDLLATIAGNLLLEGKSSHSPMDMMTTGKEQSEAGQVSFEEEKHNDENNQNTTFLKDGSSDRNFIVSELLLQAPSLNNCAKELSSTQYDTCSGPASVITTSDCTSEKGGSAENLVNGELEDGNGSFSRKADIELFGCWVSPGCKLEGESKKQIKVEPYDFKLSISTRDNVSTPKCPMVCDKKPFRLGSSDDSLKFSMSSDHIPSDHIPSGSLPFNRESVKLVSRDDDENSSACTHRSTKNKAFRPSPCVGDRKIRKLLVSKYWKVAPTLKDKQHISVDVETNHGFPNGKSAHKRQRCESDYPFKKRKLYDCSSFSNSDGGISSDGSKSPVTGFGGNASTSMPSKVAGPSTPAIGKHGSLRSKNSPVKLKIKSFRVPELFIEIPETASIGSLKKTVMEAVNAILGGGFHVGVLLQGKKIRDDNKTLLQTGISLDSKLDTLGFTLEPNTSHVPQPVNPEDSSYILTCDAPEPLSRYPPEQAANHTALVQRTSDSLPDISVANLNNFIESDHDSAPSPPDTSVEKSTVDSRALVAVPAMDVGALAVVPMRKCKRAEVVQRRIRRPFSVSEVEALVQAVEKLGTGRWRDVKLRAFDNAKHRTYVDLKDKWKTLVHTAKISPQQRRGEPVPQELLDRVLTAHAYWLEQQVKQQYKHQSETCRLP